MEEPGQKQDFLANIREAINSAPERITKEQERTGHTWLQCFSSRAHEVAANLDLAQAQGSIDQEKFDILDRRVTSLNNELKIIRLEHTKEGQPTEITDIKERERLLRMLNIFEEPEEEDYLELAKKAILDAKDSIQIELDRKTSNTWFNCFNSVANNVLGYFELAKVRQNLNDKDLDYWNTRAQNLKDEIERRREETKEKETGVEEVGEEDRPRFIAMLDIFKNEER